VDPRAEGERHTRSVEPSLKVQLIDVSRRTSFEDYLVISKALDRLDALERVADVARDYRRAVKMSALPHWIESRSNNLEDALRSLDAGHPPAGEEEGKRAYSEEKLDRMVEFVREQYRPRTEAEEGA
jgi:hypothetical protein